MTPPAPPSVPRRDASPRTVRVGSVHVDLATNEVLRDGEVAQRLSPKSVQVLRILLAQGDQPIHREQLFARAWPGKFRTDDVVHKAMQELRRALADQPGQVVIETIPRVGYRLVSPVEWLDAPVAASRVPEAAIVTPAIAHRSRARQFVAAVVVALVALGTAFRANQRESTAMPVDAELAGALVASRIDATPLRTDPGDEAYAAISPDGTLVAVAAKGVDDPHYRVRVRDIASGRERKLLDAQAAGDELAPSWSRDGRTIAYYRNDAGACTLELASAMGLDQRVLSTCVSGLPMPLEFTPDGSALVVSRMAIMGEPRKPGFVRVDLLSGRVSDFDAGPAAAFGFEIEARFSPDGRKLLVQRGVAPFSSLVLIDLEAPGKDAGRALGERFNAIGGVTWLPDNRHAVLASDNLGVMELWRIDTVSGALERFGGLGGRQPSAARMGDALVYSRLDRPSGLRRIDARADAPGPAVFASTRAEDSPAITRDGKRLAFVSDRLGQAQVFVGDVAGDAAMPVTTLDAGRPFDLSFSSDGRQLAFSLRTARGIDVRIVDVATHGVNTPRLGVERTIDLRFGDDPHELLFTAWDADDRAHVYAQRQDDPASARRVSSCSGRAPRADGRGWIYFLGAGPPKLARVRADGIDAACEPVSDRVRWLNRNAWVADDAGLLAVLTPLDRVARAGVYRLTEPPELLVALPELALRPTSSIELVGHGDHLIGALPALSSSDVWIVRGTTSAQPSLASR